MQNIPSEIIAEAVKQFSKLPGVGYKTALRFVIALLKKNKDEVMSFANSIINLVENLKVCKICHNFSDEEICQICSNPHRNHQLVCVVEDIDDLIAIENTMSYDGLYHILGGLISPLNGIGPKDLNIDTLEQRIQQGNIKELIVALSANVDGDTTSLYLYRRFSNYPITLTTIARGVGFGDDLQYTDEITLSRAIENRLPLKF